VYVCPSQTVERDATICEVLQIRRVQCGNNQPVSNVGAELIATKPPGCMAGQSCNKAVSLPRRAPPPNPKVSTMSHCSSNLRSCMLEVC